MMPESANNTQMLDITAQDIKQLDDENLRALVARLCELEVERQGHSTSCVKWGGNQNAADDGIDVFVDLPSSSNTNGFLPRKTIGLQVKACDFLPGEIDEEMRPNGQLRMSICDLADNAGAYIIVASGSSTSYKALRSRLDAMKACVQLLPNARQLHLDFYDSSRLATWVRTHPTLIPWVREKIGKPMTGWRAFGNWSNDPSGVETEYAIDEEIRIITPNSKGGPVPTLAGINELRGILREPGSVVRLVGLSGVGKTRLVQALFDKRVGQNSLDPSGCIYADLAETPTPSPTELAAELIAQSKKAILVLDNCPPELHRRLSEMCRVPESRISVITVEYDIQDDLPEGTEVFRLESYSSELIEKILKRRFPLVSELDRNRIGKFSNGNARIAIALADTVGPNESIAGLRDGALFNRLFHQRKGPNDSLLKAAEALSLSYSFNGEETATEGSACDLAKLGSLINEDSSEMFRHTSSLQSRGLVQSRGKMRAVLPQAIANRLAANALRSISISRIEDCFAQPGSERLLKSFSRRLGYLTGNAQAVEIVKRWLSPGGRLGNLLTLDALNYELFSHIAPVSPEDTLSAIQRVSNDLAHAPPGRVSRYLRVLRLLAYEPSLFERCCGLLTFVARSSPHVTVADEATKALASLFPIYYSGTHANIEQRLGVIEPLVCSDNPKEVEVGLASLKCVLQAAYFSSGYDLDFGTRSRDYGYQPRSLEEIKKWYDSALRLAQKLVTCSNEIAIGVRSILAEQFRWLWNAGVAEEMLDRVCRAVASNSFWSDGWNAVRQTLYYDSNGLNPQSLPRLKALETYLRPKGLVQQVRAIVFSESIIYVGLDSTRGKNGDDVQINLQEIEKRSHDLGKDLGSDHEAFEKLLPELTAARTQQLWQLALGLAESTGDLEATWTRLVAEFASQGAETRSPQLISGFLQGLHQRDPELANVLLDGAVTDPVLADLYPYLQAAVGVDLRGEHRLLRSIECDLAHVRNFRVFGSGQLSHSFGSESFHNFVLGIAAKEGGFGIAADILGMRMSFDKTWNDEHESEMLETGRALLAKLKPGDADRFSNHRIGTIAKRCLKGPKGIEIVRQICRDLKSEMLGKYVFKYQYSELLGLLLSLQPTATLQELCGGDADDLKVGLGILEQSGRMQGNPFDELDEGEMLSWCDKSANLRYPAVALGITSFRVSNDGNTAWTEKARRLLARAPDKVAVLESFARELSTAPWMGSSSKMVKAAEKLLGEFLEDVDGALRECAASEILRIKQAAEMMERPVIWNDIEDEPSFEKE
jgi:hypothetical protein